MGRKKTGGYELFLLMNFQTIIECLKYITSGCEEDNHTGTED